MIDLIHFLSLSISRSKTHLLFPRKLSTRRRTRIDVFRSACWKRYERFWILSPFEVKLHIRRYIFTKGGLDLAPPFARDTPLRWTNV